MENSEKIEFYQISELNNQFYKLSPFSIDTKDEKDSFHIKITENDHQQVISPNKISKKIDNNNKKNKLLSTVHNFNNLVEKMPKLDVTHKSILKKKFQNFKLKKNIFCFTLKKIN